MAKTSKALAGVKDLGPVEESVAILDGYEAAFLTVKDEMNLAPLLKGLPDDQCPCPHWGYVFKGQVTWTKKDGSTEVTKAGEAFHIEPGHTPAVTAGTEWLLFSPAELSDEVNAVIEKNAAAMQQA